MVVVVVVVAVVVVASGGGGCVGGLAGWGCVGWAPPRRGPMGEIANCCRKRVEEGGGGNLIPQTHGFVWGGARVG